MVSTGFFSGKDAMWQTVHRSIYIGVYAKRSAGLGCIIKLATWRRVLDDVSSLLFPVYRQDNGWIFRCHLSSLITSAIFCVVETSARKYLLPGCMLTCNSRGLISSGRGKGPRILHVRGRRMFWEGARLAQA